MAPITNAGRSLVEFLVTLLIGLAPVACGVLVLVWHVDRKQEETIEVTAREAVYAIDRVIESLHSSSGLALRLAEKPCDAILPQLRKEVFRHPNVRSVALKRQGRVFCSTLYGPSDYAIEPGGYVNEQLRVEPGNSAIPGSAILLYRMQSNPYAAIAVANLRVLQAELLGFQNSVVLNLQFGNQHVWATGNGEYYRVPNHSENALQLISERYGYTVHAGYPAGESWDVVSKAMHTTLPSLLLVGIITSAAGYWGLFRRVRRQ